MNLVFYLADKAEKTAETESYGLGLDTNITEKFVKYNLQIKIQSCLIFQRVLFLPNSLLRARMEVRRFRQL